MLTFEVIDVFSHEGNKDPKSSMIAKTRFSFANTRPCPFIIVPRTAGPPPSAASRHLPSSESRLSDESDHHLSRFLGYCLLGIIVSPSQPSRRARSSDINLGPTRGHLAYGPLKRVDHSPIPSAYKTT
ncbi:hypothetical protein A4X09_0g6611 [Tilletia walkeri]|uniref:Uncharacterized protein n=1 Tax=Tilletia walkeri TaxID=117179 RepID=A0A8X7T274_9BASI|nr:hypothetical protein A4X09_0g6611 [Tilletia walkeri]